MTTRIMAVVEEDAVEKGEEEDKDHERKKDGLYWLWPNASVFKSERLV